jgi:putative ABC transport system substrate-binding protein
VRRREFIPLIGGAAVAWPLTRGIQRRHSSRPRCPDWACCGPGHLLTNGTKHFVKAYGRTAIWRAETYCSSIRWAEGKQERLPELAEELVCLKVDLIVTISAPAILAVKKATTEIPISHSRGRASPDP